MDLHGEGRQLSLVLTSTDITRNDVGHDTVYRIIFDPLYCLGNIEY